MPRVHYRYQRVTLLGLHRGDMNDDDTLSIKMQLEGVPWEV